jgi:tetratricopeptide (TPR) repeat protein
LAIAAFERFLDRWPMHERAADMRQTVDQMKPMLLEEVNSSALSTEEALELTRQNEEVQFFMSHAQFSRGKRIAEKILSHHPSFTPALNNLSQIYDLEGDPARAITTEQKVLEAQPDNVHALSNLARMLLKTGHPDQAREFAVRLKASQAPGAEVWTKKVEAFSALGDDRQVIALYEQARAAGDLANYPSALFYHLVAVSMAFLGREREARQLWKKALQYDQSLSVAQENLADLQSPVEARHGPWAFQFTGYWVPEKLVQETAATLPVAKRNVKDEAIQAAAERFLRNHPELISLAPLLLARGGADAQEFFVSLAMLAENHEMLAAVRDFVLGDHGADELRMKAAEGLSARGWLPSSSVRMWVQGEWRELLLYNYEITQETTTSYRSPEAEKLAVQALDALRSNRSAEAQALLEQAIALEPDEPSLLNNLALALEMQGRSAEGYALVHEVRARFPDYFFGIAGEARLAIKAGNLETAHQILDGLTQHKKFHITEFVTLCQAQIDLLLAEKNPRSAGAWLEMWEKADPEHPQLGIYRALIARSGGLLQRINPFH